MALRVTTITLGASLLALSLASCSQSPPDRSSTTSADETAPSRTGEAPDIAPTAAPGVSFRYAYEFIVPDDHIAAAQEAHAAACERLGINQCRITGMRYSLSPDDQTITASLSLKLAPEIARGFGKEALETVKRDDGSLHNLEITGEDEQPRLSGGSGRTKLLSQQIADLRKRLADPDNDPDEKISLQQQITQLEQQLQESKADVTAAAERLANTPMTFEYYGRGGVPGFRGNPVREAWHLFIATGVTIIAFLLRAVAVMVPLALVVALFLLLWRSRPMRGIRRWFWQKAESADGGDHPGHA